MSLQPAPGVDPTTLVLRPVRPDAGELPTCAEIWRASIDDYLGRLGQPPLPDEVAGLLRLYTHLQATDPERFVVALDGERIVAFAAALEREQLWFLSMCFVLPDAQGRGIGRRLVARVGPTEPDPHAGRRIRATATDSAQPISNALYGSMGMVPRVPLLDLVGTPSDPAPFGSLPSGATPIPFETVVGDDAGRGEGHGRLAATVDALDRDVLGVAHPLDHRFLRQEGRRGWLLVGPDGEALGYGYASETGRLGPMAVRDATLLAPFLGWLTRAVTPRGAFAVWLPGTADATLVAALRAGFRLEPFPVLLCADRPFADFTRYLPISPGLL